MAMKPYYQIDVKYANERISQFTYETMKEATEAMHKMVNCPGIISAILVYCDDRYPLGYTVVCSIRNKSIF